jgi:hypothetical protein
MQLLLAVFLLPDCCQAKPENLVDTFILLMPATAKTANDLARVCELKVRWRDIVMAVIGSKSGDIVLN